MLAGPRRTVPGDVPAARAPQRPDVGDDGRGRRLGVRDAANIAELLAELDLRRIRLWTEAGALKFKAPKGALTAELRERIRALKQDLIESLETAAESAAEAAAAIPAAPRDRPLPLSFAQQRLWFVDQLTPGSPAYNVKMGVALLGLLDVAALTGSLKLLAARHETLRTAFPADSQGRPRQLIHAAGPSRLRVVDYSGIADEARREREAAAFCMVDADRPFDLAAGKLFRPTLCRINPRRHIFQYTIHHIVSDGQSMALLFHELSQAYEALTRGREPEPPELPIQYADFALWQRQTLEGERLDRQLAYWRERLKAPRAVLPTDRKRPPMQTVEGAAKEIHLPRELADRLNALAQAEGVTMFTLMLAAYDVLLWGYAAQEDILVGTAVAARDRAELEPLIGFFVNTLVMRVRLAPETTLRQAIARTHGAVMGAFANQDIPYERVVEDLQPERRVSRNPVFQTMFTFRVVEEEDADIGLPGLEMEALDVEIERSLFDLILTLSEIPGEGLYGGINYNVSLFREETIEAMAAALPTALDAFLADLDQPIAGLSWLPEADRRRLFFDHEPPDKRGPGVPHDLARAAREAFGNVPIGAPFANSRVYLLDPDLNPMPVGAPGELCIGGDGLARGYLGQPRVTALKFVPNPFADKPHPPLFSGSRLYRTGDLARYMPDGNLEFLGRVDFQVKLRGFRIELGEIEEALAAHPAVPKAVVRAVEDAPGDKRLIGYVLAPPDRLTDDALIAELHDHLEARLPDYMVPAAILALDAFPLTPNGKIDIKALPIPDPARDRRAGDLALPRTAVETLMAEVWSEVLRVDPIGVHDNFFHLGGHSLLAAQVNARLRNAFKVELPLRLLFERPTIAQLAAEVQRLGGDQAALAAPPIQPADRGQPLPLSLQQQRLWFLARLDPANPAYNMPMSLNLLGPLDALAFAAGIQAVVDRHEALRTRFAMEESWPEPRQLILDRLHAPFDFLDLSGLPEDDREPALADLADAWHRQPFDLEQGALIRCRLIRRGPHNHALLFGMHHLISDGLSMEVFTRELTALYRGACLDRPVDLPPLPIQYADYALWQRGWFQGETLDRQLRYWTKRLAGELPVLPTDRPRPDQPTASAAFLPFDLDAELTAAVDALARDRGCTPNMVYLAALDLALSAYSGLRDILVGTPIANRRHAETEPLIGFFVNTLTLRLDLRGNPTLGSLLARAQETALGAFAHQDLPFEKLVQQLNPVRDQRITPLFQAMYLFSQIDAPGPADPDALPEDGLRFAPFEGDLNIAVFDLTFSFAHGPRGGVASILYKDQLFEPDTARLLADHVLTALRAMTDDPGVRLAELPFMRRAARRAAVSDPSRNTPIGAPFANSRVYALDRGFQPAALGAPGELCIGGSGLARGYHGRPDLTAERFAPDPFSDRPGARLYRTGDLARFLPDGALEFLGRVDFQVKIRGFRVELGEIEAAVEAHPAVRKAVVRALPDGPAQKRLAAYVQVAARRLDDAALKTELRAHLQARLPEYMVPAAYVALDAFPLTPNGKIDIKALPVPDRAREDDGELVPPRTELEARLAEIWSEILDVSPIGVYDNFFHLGGHSLLIARIQGRVRAVLGLEMPLRALFEQPTIAALAAAMGQPADSGSSPEGPPILPVPRDGSPLPVSFQQQRLWFVARLEPDNPAYNMPFNLALDGPFDLAAFDRGLAAMSARHETLRTVFLTDAEEREPLQRVLDDLPPALAVVDLSALPDQARPALTDALADAWHRRPFDLEAGPLVRALIVRRAAQDHALLFGMHHIISDGLSTDIFVREIALLYRGFSRGHDVALPPLRLHYADYAAWQRGWLRGETLDRQLDYWRARMAGPLPVLPTDRPRPHAPTSSAAFLPFPLTAEQTRRAEQLASAQSCTLFMVYLAAFDLALCAYTGQRDAVIGTPIANRRHAEVEPLIGFFVNTLALRLKLAGNPSLATVLRRAQDAAVGAFAHQDFPFAKLVQELNPDRDQRITPIFQAMYLFDKAAPAAAPAEDGDPLAFAPMAGDAAVAVYDLTLSVSHGEDGGAVSILYKDALYERATIEAMAGCFTVALDALTGDLDRRLSELEFIGPVKRTLAAGSLDAGHNTPIGAPFANSRVYALDRHFQPAALGAPGELCLGGAGLARGYHGRSDLTAERFVPDPFSAQPGARLYRTGDLARFLPDGNLEFLGRVDFQVKIRGFRVELGEIEAALERCPIVNKALALVRRDRHGSQRLTAYVTTRAPSADAPSPEPELRAWCRARLPDYMVPAAFVILDAFPLGPNGKIDRRALPAADPKRVAEDGDPPRDAIERELAAIWETLLDTAPVGVHANFFELGGHSLLGIGLMSQIQKRLGANLPVSALFQNPTVSGLAQLVRRSDPTMAFSPLTPIKPSGVRPPLFLVHAVGGDALCYFDLARALPADQPVYAFEAPGLDGVQRPETGLAVLSGRYIDAVKTAGHKGPWRLGGWSLGGVIAWEMARQLEQGGEEAQLFLLDSYIDICDRAYAETDLALGFLFDLAARSGRTFTPNPEALSRRTGREALSEALRQAQAQDAAPPDLDDERLHRLFAVYRANLLAAGAYRPKPIRGRATLLRAANDRPGYDARTGWLARGFEVDAIETPGHHYSMLKPPNAVILAKTLADLLDP